MKRLLEQTLEISLNYLFGHKRETTSSFDRGYVRLLEEFTNWQNAQTDVPFIGYPYGENHQATLHITNYLLNEPQDIDLIREKLINEEVLLAHINDTPAYMV